MLYQKKYNTTVYCILQVIPKIETATITDTETLISQDGKNKNN